MISSAMNLASSRQAPGLRPELGKLRINEPRRLAKSSLLGSVRARANKYRLSWDEANPGSCGLQNGQHGRGPPEVEQSAAVGGHMLMVAGARAEKVAQFVVSPAEPGC